MKIICLAGLWAGRSFLAYFTAMKAASVREIDQELKRLPPARLAELCTRLARFKKENKELLTYLLFEADDLDAYIKNVREEMDEGFGEVNRTQLYQAKKTLRKILRSANKYIRYTGSKIAEVEILLHYCTNFKGLSLPYRKSPVLVNLYNAQLKKISSAIDSLHEDLQHEYLKSYNRLSL